MVPMTPPLALAAVVGAALGTGLWLLASLAPRLGRPRLTTRLAPYLVDVSAEARELTRPRSADPLPLLGAMVAPLADALGRTLDSMLGGHVIIRTRLRQSGSEVTVTGHRARQLLGAALGGAAGRCSPVATAESSSPSASPDSSRARSRASRRPMPCSRAPHRDGSRA